MSRAVDPIQIRCATVDDTAAVTQLLEALEHPSSETFVCSEIKRTSTKEQTRILVADNGNGPVGFLSLGVADPYYEAPPFARIRALCVGQPHRRDGIGSQLVQEAERLAIETGCSHIEVDSHVRREEAHAFYQRNGYIENHRHFVKFLPTRQPSFDDSLLPITRDLLTTAIDAANAAGAIQKAGFGHHPGITSQFAHDLKLETDKRCEDSIIERIRASFPDHAIAAEESGMSDGTGDYVWIIDPLDGTVNFYHGVAHFCTSVACYRRKPSGAEPIGRLTDLGEPVIGVVYDAIGNNRFIGIKGHGATLNGIALQPLQPPPLDKSMVTLALGSHEATMQEMLNIQSILLRRARKLRVLGASALEICLIAQGVSGGHLQARINAWDFAAAGLILEEVGGCIHAREFEPGLWRMAACTSQTEAPLRELMKL